MNCSSWHHHLLTLFSLVFPVDEYIFPFTFILCFDAQKCIFVQVHNCLNILSTASRDIQMILSHYLFLWGLILGIWLLPLNDKCVFLMLFDHCKTSIIKSKWNSGCTKQHLSSYLKPLNHAVKKQSVSICTSLWSSSADGHFSLWEFVLLLFCSDKW